MEKSRFRWNQEDLAQGMNLRRGRPAAVTTSGISPPGQKHWIGPWLAHLVSQTLSTIGTEIGNHASSCL